MSTATNCSAYSILWSILASRNNSSIACWPATRSFVRNQQARASELMPYLQHDDARIHYEIEGPPGAPAIVFSNSLGTDLCLWDGQASVLANRFRVLRYDTRGHGQTSVTPEPYHLEQLAGDVIALLDSLAVKHATFCGLSMGGQTGLWLAIHHPDRIDGLVACNTGAK